jgi:predicted metalloprotease with PDZ domain
MSGSRGHWMRALVAGGALAVVAGGPAAGLALAEAGTIPPAAGAAAIPGGDTITAAEAAAERLERMNERIEQAMIRLAQAQELQRAEITERAHALALHGEALAQLADTIRLRVARDLPRIEVLRDGLAVRLQDLGSIRPRLGVSLEEVDGRDEGARVASVSEGGGAEAAGIREGDEIMAIDGERLIWSGDTSPIGMLTDRLRDREEGDTVRITIRRDGTERDVPVELRMIRAINSPGVIRLRSVGPPGAAFERRAPAAPRVVVPRAGAVRVVAPRATTAPQLVVSRLAGTSGLELADLNPGLAGYFGRDAGALVLDVSDRAPEGIQAGDVITAIDGRAVENAADVRRILGSYRSGEAVRFELWREGRTAEVESRVR